MCCFLNFILYTVRIYNEQRNNFTMTIHQLCNKCIWVIYIDRYISRIYKRPRILISQAVSMYKVPSLSRGQTMSSTPFSISIDLFIKTTAKANQLGNFFKKIVNVDCFTSGRIEILNIALLWFIWFSIWCALFGNEGF